jgi:ubiquinone/menaquinone biosynthesis C-methylase UbiE
VTQDHETLRKRYEEIALSGDEKTTACDFNLRELEIALGLESIRDGDVTLDVGCGPGVALRAYASHRAIEAHGIDYAENMAAFARERNRVATPHLKIDVRQADVMHLPYKDAMFDVVTSSRCLMALLDWDRQKSALTEICRVLKPGGRLVLMEGTLDGLERLNAYRRKFGLAEIEADGRDRLTTLKFREKDLLDYCAGLYELKETRRFGMYYFLTRIVQPLLVAPDPPRYDHKLNEIARRIAGIVPDFEGIGHLVGFVFEKRTGAKR